MWVGDVYPYWDAVEVFDSRGQRTLAYDLIQQLVCSASRHVQGDPSDPFLLGVCEWRQAGIFGSPKAESAAMSRRNGVPDTCNTVEEAHHLATP